MEDCGWNDDGSFLSLVVSVSESRVSEYPSIHPQSSTHDHRPLLIKLKFTTKNDGLWQISEPNNEITIQESACITRTDHTIIIIVLSHIILYQQHRSPIQTEETLHDQQ